LMDEVAVLTGRFELVDRVEVWLLHDE
jgi:hypothetical protein